MWFSRSLGYRLLSIVFLPFTILFWSITTIRKFAYQCHLKKSVKLPVPVIIVGNISVGGNGKTPLVVTIVEWLNEAGYKPGVLSRGYGGKTPYPATVTNASLASEVGDEPLLLKQRLSCPIVVDPIRPRGGLHLIEQHQCDIIVCDDGLQHYALRRDIEIAVVDGVRLFGNGFMLPMGPLRENQSRLESVDFVIFNGQTSGKKLTAQLNKHTMELQPADFVNLANPSDSKPIKDMTQPATALAGIGYPQRFFDLLKQHGVNLEQTLSFVDHHQFSAEEIPTGTVLMTEKDAVKCQKFAQSDWWYLPVNAQISGQFKQHLLAKLDKLNK